MLQRRRFIVAFLLIAGASRVLGRNLMSSSSTPSYGDLMRLGRVQVMDRVPEGSRQSLPIPVRVDSALRVAFFYAPSQVLPGVNRLAPPNFMAWLDPSTGALLALKAVTPHDFGQSCGANDLIGEYRLPEGMTANEYLAERERLFGLYGNLVPTWMAGAQGGGAGLRLLAQEFLRSFAKVSEPPLIPYYYAMGREFFDWVRAAAKQ